MKRKFTKFFMIISALLLVACGGGNGGGDPISGLDHDDLAREFVRSLNLTGDYDVELVKDSTLVYDYIVVYDRDLGTYDAYDIGNYQAGMNISTFIANNQNNFYYDLRRIPGHYEYTEEWDYYYDPYYGDYVWGWVTVKEWIPTRYLDRYTGVLFEKTTAGGKDLEKMAALGEQLILKKNAEKIAANFGLSAERSLEVARLTKQWEKNSKQLTDADHDAFAKELLGVSITDAKSAIQKSFEGDSTSLEQVIDQAASTNGVSPEHMSELVSELFVE